MERNSDFQGWESRKRGPHEPKNVLKSYSALSWQKGQRQRAEAGAQFKNRFPQPPHHAGELETQSITAKAENPEAQASPQQCLQHTLQTNTTGFGNPSRGTRPTW